jgi:hypothetical protein
MEFSNSLRFLTGDAAPPIVADFITAQDVNDLVTAAHINNVNIHREMDDAVESTTTLWSSSKTASESLVMNDKLTSTSTLWSSTKTLNKISSLPEIDDNVESLSSLWSSTKISDEIANGSNSFDQDLNTIDDVQFAGVETNVITGDVTVTSVSEQASETLGTGTKMQIRASNSYVDSVSTTTARSRGSLVTPNSILDGDLLSETQVQGYDGVSFRNGTRIVTTATSDWSIADHGSSMQFDVANAGEAIPDPKLLLDSNGVTVLDNMTLTQGAITADNTTLQLGNTSDTNAAKCVSMLFVAANAIGVGRLVKVVASGLNEPRVTVVTALDEDNVGIIGVTMSYTTAPGQDIRVCIGGIFTACISNTRTINIGDLIEKTDDPTQDGRVWAVAPGVGSVGVALSSGTGDAAGSVFVRGIFLKNEVL